MQDTPAQVRINYYGGCYERWAKRDSAKDCLVGVIMAFILAVEFMGLVLLKDSEYTHRLQSSSFLWFIFRIL